MSDKIPSGFAAWAIVQLFGHSEYAGYVHEVELVGAKMLQINVPYTDEREGFEFSIFRSAGAIYGIDPVDEQVARARARSIRARPVHAYQLVFEPPALRQVAAPAFEGEQNGAETDHPSPGENEFEPGPG
jgi:hypothetical protein